MKKEFNLKKERQGRLRDYLRNLGLHNLEIDNVLRVIEVQDKEFIEILKKRFEVEPTLTTFQTRLIINEIDKLSGEL